MTGPNRRICMFEKFNFCKKKDCQYFHPSEICDETCDIKKCLKKHTQTQICMFYTVFEKCKHGQNCKFRHDIPQQDENVINDSKMDEIKKEFNLKLLEKEKQFSSQIAEVKAENVRLRKFCHHQEIFNNELKNSFEAVKKELVICLDYLASNDDPDFESQSWQSFHRDAQISNNVTPIDDDVEETKMITEESVESTELNVIDMEQEQHITEDKNSAKTSKYQPKNDFHNLNYLTNEIEHVKNIITKGKMTDKKVYDCKQHMKKLRSKMNLKFKKNKESDKKVISSFDKMCKKIELTTVRPLISFRKMVINECKEFLEICNKEMLKCKK